MESYQRVNVCIISAIGAIHSLQTQADCGIYKAPAQPVEIACWQKTGLFFSGSVYENQTSSLIGIPKVTVSYKIKIMSE